MSVSESEIWAIIPGYGGRYMISSKGRARSLFRGVSNPNKKPRDMIATIRSHGYRYIYMCKPGTRDQKAIHKLVMEAFGGKRPRKHQVAHIDGNPLNNDISNLMWASAAENASHKYRHGTAPIGSKHWNTNLHERDVVRIRELNRIGIKTSEIAKKYRVGIRNVRCILRRDTWRHVP